MDELKRLKSDLIQLARLALEEKTKDVEVFSARIARKYRDTDPEFASKINDLLRVKVKRFNSMRGATGHPTKTKSV